MKVLVIYFSQTGNTEKIATALYDEVSKTCDADLEKLEEADPDILNQYDLLFIGSPIHAGSLAREVDSYLKKIPEGLNLKFVGFITHAAPAYPRQMLNQMIQPFIDRCREKGIRFSGCFSCQGYLADFMHEAVQKMQKADDDEWQKKVEQMTGHPSEVDETKARAFVREILTSF